MTRMAIAAVVALLGMTATASAAGPGEVLRVADLPLPPGGFPAGVSGSDGDAPAAAAASADGRYVAFSSDAEALAAGAHPDVTNVFRKDRATGEVVLVSRPTGLAEPGPATPARTPRIAAGGNLVAWLTRAQLDPADGDGLHDVYVRDVAAGTTTLATPAVAQEVSAFDLSANGAWIAFATEAALVGGDGNAGATDVYRRRLGDGFLSLVSRIPAAATAGNGDSTEPSISGDGRWVAFASEATNLVAGFAPGAPGADVFARDMTSFATYLVSRQSASATTGANGESRSADLAGTPGAALADVRVAYSSFATDISAADTSADSSIYVRRLSEATTTLVSRATGLAGANADSRAHSPAISADGAKVAFASDAANLGAGDDYYGVYLRDVVASTTVLGSADNAYAVEPALSADGSVLTWINGTSDLVAGGDPEVSGVFARSLPAGPVDHVSRPPGTAPFLSAAARTDRAETGERTLSADGRYAVFTSYSPRLVPGVPGPQVYRRDLRTGALDVVSRSTGPAGAPASGFVGEPTISADGTRVAFTSSATLDPATPHDGAAAVYVRDLAAGTTELVSRGDGAAGPLPDADASRPALSAEGRHVLFTSAAGNLGTPGGDEHVYWRDLAAGRTQIVDRATGPDGTVASSDSRGFSLSRDGRVAVFSTSSPGLDPADPAPGTDSDVFVRDTSAHTTQLVSRAPGADGADTSGPSYGAVISSDATKVVFASDDDALAPEAGPWGSGSQVVLRDLVTHQNTLVSRAPGGPPADADASQPTVNADGSVIAFESAATNLIAGLGGEVRNAVFVRATATGALSGPPAFGLVRNEPQQGASAPSLSEDGQCVAFDAAGSNAVSGAAGDVETRYVYVISGTCPKTEPVVAPPPGATTPRPAITGARLSRTRFRAGRKGTARIAAKRGTTLRFTLSADADVTVGLQRRAAGRRVGTTCRKPARKLRKRPKCARFVPRGTLVRRGQTAGAKAIAFSGRVGRRKLAPGRYRMVLRASNAGGRSDKVTLAFRIVRR